LETRLAVGQQETAERGVFDMPDSVDFGLKPCQKFFKKDVASRRAFDIFSAPFRPKD
jgi:hypothetical protein